MSSSIAKVELFSCNLLECLQQAYAGTLLESKSDADTRRNADVDDDDDDELPARARTNAESALERLFADDADSDVMVTSLVRATDLTSTLVLVTRKVNVFIATSTVYIAHGVTKGTVGAQMRVVPSHCDGGEYITDVTIVELADNDVVCVLAGYSRGHVRAFDANGRLLFSKRFDDQPVMRLRLRSDNLASGPFANQSEDFSVLYAGGLVVHIAGLDLYRALMVRVRRSDAGDATAGDDAIDLPYRKWRLTGCAEILDVAVLGVRCREVLQLRAPPTASASSNANGGATIDIVGVGLNPAFALFDASADESAISSAVTVAQDAAVKLASAVVGFARSWWSTPAPASAPTPTANIAPKAERFEPPVNVPLRCGVFDEQRRIHRIVLSASGHLAATCDSLGRVALLDVQHLAMVKLWKGYRDAQVAWLLSCASGHVEQYLLLHAPRRQQLELWRARHATRPLATETIGRAMLVQRGGVRLGSSGERRGDVCTHAMIIRANGTVAAVRIK